MKWRLQQLKIARKRSHLTVQFFANLIVAPPPTETDHVASEIDHVMHWIRGAAGGGIII